MGRRASKLALAVLVVGVTGFAASDVIAQAHTSSPGDPRVADLQRAGQIRLGMFPPQYAKDPATGELRGVAQGLVHLDVARALAARMGVQLVPVGLPSPREVVGCLRAGECDLAFMGVEPARAAEVAFAPHYLEVDFTFMVPAGSAIASAKDVDRPGIRVAAVRGHTSTLVLTAMRKHATMIEVSGIDEGFDLLRRGQADAWAAARPALLDYVDRMPGARLLADRYGVNTVALAAPKGMPERLAYISEFIEEAKASGLVAKAVERAGLRGVQAAPAVRPVAR